MANLDLPTTRSIPLAQRATQLISSVRDARRRRAVYLRTLSELQRLSDRDLADLDIQRAEIAEIARDAASKV